MSNRFVRRCSLLLVPAVVFALSACGPGSIVVGGGGGAVTDARVVGNRLVDGAGRPLSLMGANRSGSEYACVQGWGIFDGPVDDAAVAAMQAWKINAVRVPLNEHCWLGVNGVAPAYSGPAYRDAITAYARRLLAKGIVVVLDLHWSAPGTTLATGQAVMPDADHAVDFWTSVATTFRADRGIVFDLFNEPRDVGWDCWRDGCTTEAGWQAVGMQRLVDAVRATGAAQPVIATGLGWGNDLYGWLSHPLHDPMAALVAGVHVYNFSGCATAACWDDMIAPVAAQVPVVAGEFGEDTCGHAFVDAWMQWADGHGVSYLAWAWDAWPGCNGPALVLDYQGTPTTFGEGVRSHYVGRAA